MNRQKNDQWIAQLRKGTFELAILSLLNTKAMYGYQITAALAESEVFAISQGAVYPILKRMTASSWIEFFWETSAEGPKRKYYQITAEGKKVLDERLALLDHFYHSLHVLNKEGQE